MSSLDSTVDLKQYARMAWRHKGIIALCPIAVVCATLIALAFVPNEYEATLTLAVEDPGLVSRDVEDLTGGIMQPPSGYRADEERLAQVSSRISSRPFLERLTRMLKMQEDPNVRAQAEERCRAHPEITVDEMATRILVESLQSRISFSATGPGVYRVSVSDYSATNARLIAWWIGELFVDTSDQETLESIRDAEVFAHELLGRYDDRLRRSEEALEASRQGAIERRLSYSLISNENLSVAEALLRRIEDDASQARIRNRVYGDSLAKLAPAADPLTLVDDPRIADLEARLSTALWNEVVDRMSGGRTTERSSWPPSGAYGSLRRDLLQQAEFVATAHFPQAGAQITGTLGGYAFSKIDADALHSAALGLSQAIGAFRRQAESTPGGEIELSRRQGEVERNRRLRDKVEDYIVGTDVRRSVETARLGLQIEILDPPGLPMAPTRPHRSKILLASFLLGTILGLGCAFAVEVVDPVLHSVDDFSRSCPEPILGMTPLLARRVEIPRPWLRRHWLPLTLAAIVLLTSFFLAASNQILYRLAPSGIPVQVVDPGKVTDENR